MSRETVIALDLEGTLISNAVSQFPRPGLYSFLDFCHRTFERVYLYTAVRDAVCEPILQTLVSERSAPDWLLDVPLVQWNREFKDLNNIPDAQPLECLLVDDNADYVVDDQLSQWMQIAKYESPYPDSDRELDRVKQVIHERVVGK